jgi:hypothetical protein
MVSSLHEGPTLSTISPTFTDGFLIRGTLFVVREARVAPEISIILGTGYSHASVITWRNRHAVATCLNTVVGGGTRARFFTCITSPSRPLYSRLSDSAFRHHRTTD